MTNDNFERFSAGRHGRSASNEICDFEQMSTKKKLP